MIKMKSCPKMGADEAVEKLHKEMGGFTPQTLHHIKQHHPQLAATIHDMDRIVVEDGATGQEDQAPHRIGLRGRAHVRRMHLSAGQGG